MSTDDEERRRRRKNNNKQMHRWINKFDYPFEVMDQNRWNKIHT